MTPHELQRAIKEQAGRLGFDWAFTTPADQAAHADFFEAWLDLGRAGEMQYLARHLEKRRTPARLAPQGETFRSMIVLGVNYHQFDLPSTLRDDPSRGVIAAYAWGDDYHELMRPLLYALDEFVATASGRATRGKCLVDTGPVLERDWAERAGLGFIGKNCCTIRPREGSWLLLATILIPEVTAYDPPPQIWQTPRSNNAVKAADVAAGLPWEGDYGHWTLAGSPESPLASTAGPQALAATCGRCTRCLSACPTNAFVGPYHLDPQRCISYWTIEARGPIPRPLRARFGNRIFGCDICQEVCPWNLRLSDRTPRLPGLHAQVGRMAPPLLEGFMPETPYWLDDDAFRARFRRSPVRRPKRAGMLRNVCIALGNWGDPEAIDALRMALRDDAPTPRGHAAWALGEIIARHNTRSAKLALAEAYRVEKEPYVQEEIDAAQATIN